MNAQIGTVLTFIKRRSHALRSESPGSSDSTESGYVTGLMLCIIILLVATSAMMLSTASSAINVSRRDNQFVKARDGLADGTAAFLAAANPPYSMINPKSGITVSRTQAVGGTGLNSWTWDPSADTFTVTGSSQVKSGFQADSQTNRIPMRWRAVGSQTVDPTTGTPVYGIAANGTDRIGASSVSQYAACGTLCGSLFYHYSDSIPTITAGQYQAWATNAGVWEDGLASSSDSTVMGTFAHPAEAGRPKSDLFGYGEYGGALNIGVTGTVNTTTTLPQVIAYTDAAMSGSVTGTLYGGGVERSALTAQMDLNLLFDKINNSDWGACTSRWSTVSPTFSPTAGTAYCWGNSASLGGTINTPSSGIVTLIVNGSLTINGNITQVGTGQIHIYSTGNITFNPSTTGTYQGVFVYAPNGSCKMNSPSQTIQFTGAMGCKTLDFESTGNKFTQAQPLPDTPSGATNSYDHGVPGQDIWFAQTPGYVDVRTSHLASQ